MTDRKQGWFAPMAIVIATLAMVACGGNVAITARPEDLTAAAAAVPEAIVLAGKVVNSRTGEWPNDRLVLLFLKGKEIGRDTTSTRDSSSVSDQGTVDGIFAIRMLNTYKIRLSQLGAGGASFIRFYEDPTDPCQQNPIQAGCERWMNPEAMKLENGDAYHWFGEMEEGSTYHIPIPSKNIEYVLKVIEGDIALLPAEIQSAGSTALQDDGTIMAVLPETGQGQTAPPDIDAQVQTIKYEPGPRLVELNKFTVSIDNCGGSAPISQKYTQSQTFIHEYHTNVTAGIGLEISLFWLKVVPQLQVESGYSNGQIETKTIEYDMQAEPKTKVTYVFTWQEEWKTGVAEVAAGGDLISIPFEIRSNLIYSTQSEPSSCQ